MDFYVLDIITDIDENDQKDIFILSCIDKIGKKVAIQSFYNNYLIFELFDIKIQQNILTYLYNQKMINNQNIDNFLQQIFENPLNYLDVKLIKRKKLFGYQENDQVYIYMRFDNSIDYKNTKQTFYKSQQRDEQFNIQLINTKYQLQINYYEDYIENHLKILNNSDIKVCSWVQIEEKHLQLQPQQENKHNTDYFYIVQNIQNIKQSHKSMQTKEPLLKILSYDIETTTQDIQRFPDPSLYSDKIVQIGAVFQYDNKITKYLITLGEINEIKDVIVFKMQTEYQILCKFFELMIYENPDIVIGYNIFGFDDKYIKIRTDYYKQFDEKIRELEQKQQRIQLYSGQDFYIQFNKDSSNGGQNTFYVFDFKGQIRIDLLHQVKADFKFESYKLDYVSNKFIKGDILFQGEDYIITNKIDGLQTNQYIVLTDDDDFDEKKTDKLKITEIVKKEKEYTLKFNKKITSSFKYKLWQLGKDDISAKDIFAAFQTEDQYKPIYDEQKINEQKKQLRTEIGKYCIIDCYLVLLLAIQLKTVLRTRQMAYISNIPYRYIIWKAQGIKIYSLVYKNCLQEKYIFDKSMNDKIFVEGACVIEPIPKRYQQPVTVYDYEALYPNSIITMNLSPDTMVSEQVYNSFQNKDDVNIIEVEKGVKKPGQPIQDQELVVKYYFVKETVKQGIFPKILINLLQERKNVKNFMKTNKDTLSEDEYQIYDAQQLSLKVVCNSFYGILGATGLLYCPQIARCTTKTGRDALYQAECFVKEQLQGFFYDQSKIYDFIDKYKLKIEKGQKLDSIIKQINQQYDTKFEIVYGDSVTGNTPIMVRKVVNYGKYLKFGDIEIIRIDQLFDNKKYINQNGKEVSQCDYSVFSNGKWAIINRVIRHMVNNQTKKIYRVFTKNSFVDVTEDHSLLLCNHQQIKPLQSKYHMILQSFPYKNKKLEYKNMLTGIENIWFDQEDFFYEEFDLQVLLQQSYFNLIQDDMMPYFIFNEKNQFKIMFGGQQFEPNKVIKIIEMPYIQQYVYDLETDNSIFNAGVGQIVVKNTDSIFCYPNWKEKEEKEKKEKLSLEQLSNFSIQIGQIISEFIKCELKGVLNLQFEKIFNNFILFSKKHYIGWLHEKNYQEKVLKYSGIVLVRRDNPEIVKYLFRQIYSQICGQTNDSRFFQQIQDSFISMIEQIKKGKFGKEMFVTSKALSRNYINEEQHCHVALAQKLEQEKGIVFLSNERIPYLIVYDILKSNKTNSQKTILSQLVQHPNYLEEKNQSIDYLYYIQYQIQKPLLELLLKIYDNDIFNKYYILTECRFKRIIYSIKNERISEYQAYYKQNKYNKTILVQILDELLDQTSSQNQIVNTFKKINSFLSNEEKEEDGIFKQIYEIIEKYIQKLFDQNDQFLFKVQQQELIQQCQKEHYIIIQILLDHTFIEEKQQNFMQYMNQQQKQIQTLNNSFEYLNNIQDLQKMFMKKFKNTLFKNTNYTVKTIIQNYFQYLQQIKNMDEQQLIQYLQLQIRKEQETEYENENENETEYEND